MSESQIFRIIRWVEDTLIKDGTFSLPGRKALLKSDMEYEVVLIDATESPVECPKKSKDNTIQWQEKTSYHKVQVVVNKANRQIICTSFANGRRHDFRLFKESKLKICAKIKAVVDTGYLGIAKFHENSVIPIKRSKKRPLIMEDKVFNHVVSSEHVLNEHVIGLIKRFKIVSDSIVIVENASA
jgi:hypothetical protein